eukprot:Gb_05809 [translate_table: standard]
MGRHAVRGLFSKFDEVAVDMEVSTREDGFDVNIAMVGEDSIGGEHPKSQPQSNHRLSETPPVVGDDKKAIAEQSSKRNIETTCEDPLAHVCIEEDADSSIPTPNRENSDQLFNDKEWLDTPIRNLKQGESGVYKFYSREKMTTSLQFSGLSHGGSDGGNGGSNLTSNPSSPGVPSFNPKVDALRDKIAKLKQTVCAPEKTREGVWCGPPYNSQDSEEKNSCIIVNLHTRNGRISKSPTSKKGDEFPIPSVEKVRFQEAVMIINDLAKPLEVPEEAGQNKASEPVLVYEH